MKLQQVRDAILSLLKENLPDCTIRRPDNPRPVNRAELTVVLPGFSSERQSGDSRIRKADIEIWYRAREQNSPRDEIEKVAEKLDSILFDGFSAGNIWLCPEEEISFTFGGEGDFCCQFSVSWIETIAEEKAEMMQDLHFPDYRMDDLNF